MNIKYRLRIPSLSLIWFEVYAKDENEALRKIVSGINSETVDYSDPSVWQIERIYVTEKTELMTLADIFSEKLSILSDSKYCEFLSYFFECLEAQHGTQRDGIQALTIARELLNQRESAGGW